MRPPRFSEIFLLPLVGVCATDAFVNRHNELLFFFMPFLFVLIRMYLTQFNAPPEQHAASSDEFRSLRARYLTCEHQATVVLLLVETTSVIASIPTVPRDAWWVVASTYASYVSLRVAARGAWIRAAAASVAASEQTVIP